MTKATESATDRGDLLGGVGLEAIEGGSLSIATFDDDLAAVLTGLERGQAVWFAPDAGDLAGQIFLIVDGNGEAAKVGRIEGLLDPGKPGKARYRTVGRDGKRARLRVVDADSPRFAADFKASFAANVKRARQENRALDD